MWSNIVKKSAPKKPQKVQSKTFQKKVVSEGPTETVRYQNVDEEFEKIYSSTIGDSVGEFRDYLEESLLFVQPNSGLTNDLYKFVKYNCYNMGLVENEVDKFNEELDRELEEDEQEME